MVRLMIEFTHLWTLLSQLWKYQYRNFKHFFKMKIYRIELSYSPLRFRNPLIEFDWCHTKMGDITDWVLQLVHIVRIRDLISLSTRGKHRQSNKRSFILFAPCDPLLTSKSPFSLYIYFPKAIVSIRTQGKLELILHNRSRATNDTKRMMRWKVNATNKYERKKILFS